MQVFNNLKVKGQQAHFNIKAEFQQLDLSTFDILLVNVRALLTFEVMVLHILFLLSSSNLPYIDMYGHVGRVSIIHFVRRNHMVYKDSGHIAISTNLKANQNVYY